MKIRATIAWLGLGLLIGPVGAQAFQLRTGDGTNALVLAAGETLPGESLLVGQAIEFRGQALQDLWLLSSTAVQFDGESDGDLRMLARTVVVRGEARQNLLAYATGLQLTTTAVVRGQAALLGTTVICEGQVDGNAWIFARSVTLGGRWGGTVRVQADEIRIVPGTQIGGDLIYTAPKAPVMDSSVSIGGVVEARPTLLPDVAAFSAASTPTRFLFHGYLFMAALLVGMPFVGFFPMLAGGAVRSLRTNPWRVLLAGLVAVLGGPFLIAFAVMTVIGIPLAVMLVAVYLLLAYLAHIVVALWLGHLLLRTPGPQSFGRVLGSLATGLFVLYAASALPGVASFIVLPVLVIGAGSLLTARLPGPFAVLPPPPGPSDFKQPVPPDQPPS